MRVLLDASFADRGPSGTQVYVDGLLGGLAELGVDVHAVTGRTGRHLDPVREARWQARLARWARHHDVLHHPLPARAPTRTPQVVTVHDLAFVVLPGCFDPAFASVARRTHRHAATRADAVVVPSEATRAELALHWSVDATVAHHGPGQRPTMDRGRARHFLYVGDAEPRKNLTGLLDAYALYRATATEPLDLVIAGSAAHHVAPHPGVRPDPTPDLDHLHRHAAALVLPSLHEGFGLPALEAMHAGTPVLAARIPALREVCEDAARYADPRDPAAIAHHLGDLATVPPLREELRRRGRARAAAFSWRACAQAHLTAYEAAAARR